jgi:hypothetical protein
MDHCLVNDKSAAMAKRDKGTYNNTTGLFILDLINNLCYCKTYHRGRVWTQDLPNRMNHQIPEPEVLIRPQNNPMGRMSTECCIQIRSEQACSKPGDSCSTLIMSLVTNHIWI